MGVLPHSLGINVDCGENSRRGRVGGRAAAGIDPLQRSQRIRKPLDP